VSVGSKVRSAGATLVAVLLLGIVITQWQEGADPERAEDRQPRAVRTTGCYHVAHFTANWARHDIQARKIEWGQVSNTGTVWNVPWNSFQKNERVPCGSTLMIHVWFPQGINPGRTLCSITARGRVYEPLAPEEDRWPSCYVQEFIE
jgi:hypothetical protein